MKIFVVMLCLSVIVLSVKAYLLDSKVKYLSTRYVTKEAFEDKTDIHLGSISRMVCPEGHPLGKNTISNREAIYMIFNHLGLQLAVSDGSHQRIYLTKKED